MNGKRLSDAMKNEQLLAMVRSLQQSIDMRSNEAARTELERFKADLFSQSAMLHAVPPLLPPWRATGRASTNQQGNRHSTMFGV